MRTIFYFFSAFAIILTGLIWYFVGNNWGIVLTIIFLPLILLGFYDVLFGRTSIIRNFPIVGRLRYIMEELRPKIYQYFVESDTGGTPISRVDRETVYSRSKGKSEKEPFGTQQLVYAEGYEWMDHSVTPVDFDDMNHDPRVTIGGEHCTKPYSSSLLNVSAMSYGSLSSNAVLALNGGAQIGNFAQNTGEGGISPYHLKYGGDLIYQIGTGYFGARTKDGNFDPKQYEIQMARPSVKMGELKLSQGAKPGHGGILPAKKNNEEIAGIRGVEPHTDVLSPPYHKTFNTPIGLCNMIQTMRDHANGKPVGFKMCIGQKHEFIAICKAMVQTGIYPDFITIDGAEGGTGAAPPEFSDSVGTPYREGLSFAIDVLRGFNLKSKITVIAAGKIITGFDIIRSLALGADACNSARAMMLAIGCIQALECHTNTCPTGITTHDPKLVKGLVVSEKKEMVANFHKQTIESITELIAATGHKYPSELNRDMINRRVFMNLVKSYEEIYPSVPEGIMLDEATVPERYLRQWQKATADSFKAEKIIA